MSIITPMFPYIPGNHPIQNITPFTYRDGLTYVEVLTELRNYITKTLVPLVDSELGELGEYIDTEILALIEAVETAITNNQESVENLVDGLTEYVNNTVAGVVSQAEAALTAANDAVDNANQLIADQTLAVDAQMQQNATDMVTLTEYVDSSVESIINNSLTVVDPAVAAIVADEDSDTRVILDGLYDVNTVGDNTVAALITDDNSETRAELDARYGSLSPEDLDGINEGLIEDSMSLTRIALDVLYDNPPENLPASAITTGVFDAARVPSLPNLNGTLPITKGGTGATSKAAAKTALGITVGTAAPTAGDDGDIYLQVL